MDVSSVAPAAAAEQPAAPLVGFAQPAGSQQQADPGLPAFDDAKGTLSSAVAKLFSKGAILQPVDVNVSYRVENGSIITVFTDPATNTEVAQVPSEVMVQLAQFFDKHSGVTLDKSA